MGKQVHARFANGVFTPLEPVAFPDGTLVVLNIEAAPAPEAPAPNRDVHFAPYNGKFLPGMEDPQKIKQLLMQDDIEHYVDASQQGGFV